MGKAKTAYRIEWRPKAREDLHAILAYIGKDNPTRARSFGQELRDKIKPLAQQPQLGRTGRPGLPDYVRELVVHSKLHHFLSGAVGCTHRGDFASEARGATDAVMR